MMCGVYVCVYLSVCLSVGLSVCVSLCVHVCVYIMSKSKIYRFSHLLCSFSKCV